MKAVVFGASGQDGYYLCKLLSDSGLQILPCSRANGWDIANYQQVNTLLGAEKPNYVFHLAANSTTSHEALFENHGVIATGTINLLEAVRVNCPQCRVFITGSGVQFENHGCPIIETNAFSALSPYAVSRIQSVYAARYYRSLGLKVYVGYLFHHESPLRKSGHLTKQIVDFVRRAKENPTEKIVIGDISVRKEYGFSGDIINGIWTLVSQDKVFEAVIGTGVAYSVADWLDVCFAMRGLDWHDFVELKKDGFVPEYSVLVSNPKTINGLGWNPNVSLENLAEMMLR